MTKISKKTVLKDKKVQNKETKLLNKSGRIKEARAFQKYVSH